MYVHRDDTAVRSQYSSFHSLTCHQCTRRIPVRIAAKFLRLHGWKLADRLLVQLNLQPLQYPVPYLGNVEAHYIADGFACYHTAAAIESQLHKYPLDQALFAVPDEAGP
ncbi:hypothetical protein D3C78_874260 [compost metagenome]